MFSLHNHDEPVFEPTHYNGPQLLIEKHKLTQQVRRFQRAFPTVQAHFAVKSNPHPDVIRHFDQLGISFEIASEGELKLLRQLGIHPRKILFSNPIKSPQSIMAARDYGVLWYAFDSLSELQKLSQLVPHGFYEMRLQTDGNGAVWPLTGKFGVDMNQAKQLLDYAAQRHLPVAGLTFHVGSQCTLSSSWLRAIAQSRELLNCMLDRGLAPKLLNIGGGFPSPLNADTPSISELGCALKASLQHLPGSPLIAAEPGRFFAAPAGTLSCQVIATAVRHNEPWAFLDCGYYNGLMELNEPFGFELIHRRLGTANNAHLMPWVIAGPTCDSIDLFEPRYQLPRDTRTGDIIDIKQMGAYSSACASRFNGFSPPQVVLGN